MPAAMPIWRNVALTPDAIPAFCGGTTPIAVEASGGLTMPAPSAGHDEPGDQVRPVLPPVSPAMMIRPMPTPRPGPGR